MKGFSEKHIKDLQEVDRFALQDVKGKTIAISLDPEYPGILDFIAGCIDDYTAHALAVYLNSGSTRNMLHQIYDNAILPFDSDLLKVRLMNALDGISADDCAKKLEKKQWHLDDVMEKEEGHKAMIVKDNEGDYVLIDIDPDYANAFRMSESFGCSSSLKRLRKLSYNRHKVVED